MTAEEYKIKLAKLFQELGEAKTSIQGSMIVNDIDLLIEAYAKQKVHERDTKIIEVLEKGADVKDYILRTK